MLIMRKEPAHFIPNFKMASYHVKIGFRILTTIFTKTAFINVTYGNILRISFKGYEVIREHMAEIVNESGNILKNYTFICL